MLSNGGSCSRHPRPAGTGGNAWTPSPDPGGDPRGAAEQVPRRPRSGCRGGTIQLQLTGKRTRGVTVDGIGPATQCNETQLSSHPRNQTKRNGRVHHHQKGKRKGKGVSQSVSSKWHRQDRQKGPTGAKQRRVKAAGGRGDRGESRSRLGIWARRKGDGRLIRRKEGKKMIK